MVSVLAWNSFDFCNALLRPSLYAQRVGAACVQFRLVLPRDQPGRLTREDLSALSRTFHLNILRSRLRFLSICDSGFWCSVLACQSAIGHWLCPRSLHVLGMARPHYLGFDIGIGVRTLLQHVSAG